ncbi:MAG: hypothetical protein ACR2O4_11805 [Hyphomicrobiaceae bacterium]
MAEVFIGWDPREAEVADVCRHSILSRTKRTDLRIHDLKLEHLREQGIYTRALETRDGRMWDPISEAPMSTEFAISRFAVPLLAKEQWAIFCDCDFLWLCDIDEVLSMANPDYALMCVQHEQEVKHDTKMDGQLQLLYARKNWSSLMLWNCHHPAHKSLTVEALNSRPGRDLHRFFWLDDDEIGAIPVQYNWLEGHSDDTIEPKVIHYTRGGPWFDDWQDVAYADLWLKELADTRASRSST